MANPVLFLSSIFFGMLNLLMFYFCEYHYYINKEKECPAEIRVLEIIVAFIILTSLLNHGNTDASFKWLDRIVVYIYFILSIHIAILYEIEISYSLISLAGFFYLVSKKKQYKQNIFHILLHLTMTINNFIYFKEI